MSLRICLLSKQFPPGGGGSDLYAYELATALGDRGHQVDVYTQAGASDQIPSTHRNVEVVPISKPRKQLVTLETLYFSLKARRVVDFSQYDIVHGTLMPASTIAISHDKIKPPVILTSHSFAPMTAEEQSGGKLGDYLLQYLFHPMNACMDRSSGASADRIIAISSEMREQMVRSYGFSAERIAVISHGVDTSRFHPLDQTHPAVSKNRTTALFVGRLVKLKGADLAIESISQTDKEIELLIAGSGRRESYLRGLVAELNLEDRIRFLGHVPNDQLSLLYSSADVLLFTSNYEGFGLVFLEAMACGTPVIGPDVGGIPDIVTSGENGYIVPRNPDTIADKIMHLHANPAELDRVSEAAYETASRMTWESVAAETEKVYRTVLEKDS